MKGLTALYQGLDRGFTIEELPTPEVEPGGVLLRVTAASVCGSDLHYWRGDSPMPKERLPRVTGHEFTGHVHSLGKGVTTDSLRRPLKEGDRVAFPFFFPCQRCYHCVRGEMNVCQYRMRRNVRFDFKDYPYCDGGFAQYFYLEPNHFVFKVPDELPDDSVAPVNCALAQVMFGLNKLSFRTGDTVVVQGAGGLGIYAAAVAADRGASRVISIDGQTQRLDLARRCGATDTINITELRASQERVQRVKELTGGIGADVVVEVVGLHQVVHEGLAMTRKGGTYLTIGNLTPDKTTLDWSQLIGNQTTVMGVQHYNPWVIPAALDFLVRTKGRFDLLKLVSHTFPLDKINDAFRTAEWVGREGGSAVTRAIVNP